MSVDSKMTAIANAIRAKTGGNSPLTLDQMASEINEKLVGLDNGVLYDNGNQQTEITGGWEYKKYVSNGYGSDLVTLNASNMVIESHGSHGTVFAGAVSFNPSRLADYTKFCVAFKLTRDDSSGWCRVGVASDYNIESTTDFIAAEKIETAGTYTKEINISSVNGGYPLVGVFNGTMTITKIWLE